MAYNSTMEAIKKLRSKKAGLDDFFNPSELQAGVQDLNEQNRETDLAPDLKSHEPELEMEVEIEDQMNEDVPVRNMQTQMKMQNEGLDQGDAALPKGMYEPGDENKKGFMGKAAKLMKEKFKG